MFEGGNFSICLAKVRNTKQKAKRFYNKAKFGGQGPFGST